MGRVYSATDGCNGFVVTIIPTVCVLPTLNTLLTKILRYCGTFPPPLQTQSLSGIRKWLTTPKLQLFSNFLKLWEEPGRSLPFFVFYPPFSPTVSIVWWPTNGTAGLAKRIIALSHQRNTNTSFYNFFVLCGTIVNGVDPLATT